MLDAFVLDVRYEDDACTRPILLPMINGVDLPEIVQPSQAERRRAAR